MPSYITCWVLPSFLPSTRGWHVLRSILNASTLRWRRCIDLWIGDFREAEVDRRTTLNKTPKVNGPNGCDIWVQARVARPCWCIQSCSLMVFDNSKCHILSPPVSPIAHHHLLLLCYVYSRYLPWCLRWDWQAGLGLPHHFERMHSLQFQSLSWECRDASAFSSASGLVH